MPLTSPRQLYGAGLDPAAVVADARTRRPARLSSAGAQRNRRAHETAARLVAQGSVVYGRTTGVGALKEQQVSDPAGSSWDRQLLRSHAGGVGAELDPTMVHATMLVRLNQLGAGGAGVSPGLVDAITRALAAEAVPVARSLGSVGTGDLTVLADIGLALIGEGRWRGGAPPEPGALGPGDALAFMSSNAATAARACMVWAEARELADQAGAVAALSCEAVGANPQAFDGRVHAARGHPGQRAVAHRLSTLLAGDPPTPLRLQDRFAFRCIPQIHGATVDAIAECHRALEVEINGAGENPLIVVEEPTALHHGNFFAAYLGFAVDGMRGALAHLAALSVRRLRALLDPDAVALPAFLASGPPGSSGVLILEYTAHAAFARVRAQASPLGPAGTVMAHEVEDHASFASTSADAAAELVEALRVVIATELVAAVRALRLRGTPPRGTGIKALLERVDAHLPGGAEDRPLADDVAAAGHLLGRGVFLDG